MFLTPVYAQVQNIEIEAPEGGVTDFGNLLSAGLQVALIVAAILTFAFLIWGGIQWITSGGDKAQYEAARGRITAALVGLAIVAAAYAVMSLVGHFLGINVFNFEIPSAAS
jgi:predicted RND superfamily exporter protein